MVITFSGIDCAGKSTQIKNLEEWFESRGMRFKYVWARGGYTPFFNLLKAILRKILGDRLPAAGRSGRRDKIMKRTAITRLWLWIAVIDMVVLYGVYVRIMSMLGYVVICDRFVDDTIIDFEINYPDQFSRKSGMARMLRLVAKKPDFSFLLYIPVEESVLRSAKKNEPFPDENEKLLQRMSIYKHIADVSDYVYIRVDCMKPINEVQNEIRSCLMPSLVE